jgi:hypothetical protein
VREALEKHHRQQEHDGLPRVESSLEPDSDDGDFDIFSDEEEQGFRGLVPSQGAPTERPQGSSVLLEERAGAWPLSPSEMMVLRGSATSALRLDWLGGSPTLPEGGRDALGSRAVPSRTSMSAPEAGAVGKSFEEVPPPPLRGPRRRPRLPKVGLRLTMPYHRLTWVLLQQRFSLPCHRCRRRCPNYRSPGPGWPRRSSRRRRSGRWCSPSRGMCDEITSGPVMALSYSFD